MAESGRGYMKMAGEGEGREWGWKKERVLQHDSKRHEGRGSQPGRMNRDPQRLSRISSCARSGMRSQTSKGGEEGVNRRVSREGG